MILCCGETGGESRGNDCTGGKVEWFRGVRCSEGGRASQGVGYSEVLKVKSPADAGKSTARMLL